jgi:ATP-dependent protease Clp ATPase subunit
MFDIPSHDNIERCIISEQVVRGESDIELVLKDTEKREVG